MMDAEGQGPGTLAFLRRKLDEYFAGTYDVSTEEMLAVVNLHVKRAVEDAVRDRAELVAEAQRYISRAASQLVALQEAHPSNWRNTHEEILGSVSMADSRLSAVGRKFGDYGAPSPPMAPDAVTELSELATYGFEGSSRNFSFGRMPDGPYVLLCEAQEQVAGRARHLAQGPLKPYAYIGPDRGGLHYACYSPAGPGSHQPVFTMDQVLAAVAAARAGAELPIIVVAKGTS